MAELKGTGVIVTIRATLTLEEIEVRALEAMAGYGTDSFIKVFYEHLGKAYMEEHEKGLRSFLDSMRETAKSTLRPCDQARQVLKDSQTKALG